MKLKLLNIILIIVLSLGCGHYKNRGQGKHENQGRPSCNSDTELVGQWQGLTRQELLIIKDDCSIVSLHLGLTGFFKGKGMDYLGNRHIEITNFSINGGYDYGVKVYSYRYNLSGNLELVLGDQIIEYYRINQ